MQSTLLYKKYNIILDIHLSQVWFCILSFEFMLHYNYVIQCSMVLRKLASIQKKENLEEIINFKTLSLLVSFISVYFSVYHNVIQLLCNLCLFVCIPNFIYNTMESNGLSIHKNIYFSLISLHAFLNNVLIYVPTQQVIDANDHKCMQAKQQQN